MTPELTEQEQHSNKRDEEIKFILTMLNNRVDEIKENVLVSSELLNQGIKTSLSSDIEKTIEDPLALMLNVKEDVDCNFEKIADSIIRKLLTHKGELIQKAFKSKVFDHNLHYSIILKEDTFENRENVFHILDAYETTSLSKYFPVDFQFVPLELANEINYLERIDL